ncbi:MAG: hypothetical protein ACFFC6_05160 [Promethearchaeota archaeon]
MKVNKKNEQLLYSMKISGRLTGELFELGKETENYTFNDTIQMLLDYYKKHKNER